MKIQVIKRDGSPEDYDPKKIERVVEATGIQPNKAKVISDRITKWLASLNKKEVSSLDLRDQVIKELESTNEYAANLFKWYQKNKTKNGN